MSYGYGYGYGYGYDQGQHYYPSGRTQVDLSHVQYSDFSNVQYSRPEISDAEEDPEYEGELCFCIRDSLGIHLLSRR